MDGMAEVLEFCETPEGAAARAQFLASQVTAVDVDASLARLNAHGDESALIAYVGMLALISGQAGRGFYKQLREGLHSDELRGIVDQEWARLRAGESAEPVQYVFDDEDALVTAINEQCAVIRRGGSMEFVFWDVNGFPVFSKKRDAEIALAQYRLYVTNKKKGKEFPGFAVWLKSPDREQFGGIGFYPNASDKPDGYLNLWTGFAVEPAPGDWSLLRNHIRNNVCQGNSTQFEFLLDWMSQLYFQPEKKSGVIVVLRGLPGTGKTKVGEWMQRIVGKRHSLVVDKGKHLTGNFNGHLEGKILVVAEEAVFAGDPTAAKALKHLGTSEGFTYEGKGVDARDGDNYCRVLMTTDQDWSVSVDAMDRRYFIVDVAATHKEDKVYFAAIDAQMNNGGAEAMLHELLERGMTFAKLGKPPMTDAKRDQMRHSMSPQLKWLASVLTDGQFQYSEKGSLTSVDWPEAGGVVPKAEMLASYQASVPGYRAPPTGEEFGIFLRKHVPNLGQTKRATYPGAKARVPHYVLPPLVDVREEFLRANPGFVFEDEDALVRAANDAEPDQQLAG